MTLLLLESLGVLALFLLIIWWTMFSGRKKGELPSGQRDEAESKAQADPGLQLSSRQDKSPGKAADDQAGADPKA